MNHHTTTQEGAPAMTQSIFSLDHHLAELRQVGDELRNARYAEQVKRAGNPAPKSTSITWLLRDLLSSLGGTTRPSGLATH
jgi:hypothetical protein